MKFKIIVFLLCFVFSGTSQQQYEILKNISYYPDSLIINDDYKSAQCNLDIYYPKYIKSFATIVWYHGGGLTGGQKEIPKALMDKGFAVIGVGYRLSPNVKVEDCIKDAAAALAWVDRNITKYGGNADKLFISGHSAGGYLGMMITLDKKYLNTYGIDANKIAGLLPLSGQTITHFTHRKELGIKDTQPLIDEMAPLYHVRADAPPTVLITGDRELELLGRYEENAYMARMMKLTGHKATKIFELQGFDHGDMPEPSFPLLLKEISDILKMR